jgi:GWxTD domain-containing protein
MKRVLFAVLAAALAMPAFAGVSKFKGWDNSPQGYFMTKAERTQWAALNNDDDAKVFVDKFVASRGGDVWVADVAKRTEMADKYLTVGKTPGSKTLRGKAVILFGPPTSLSVSDGDDAHVTRENPAMASAMTSGSSGSGGGDGVRSGGGASASEGVGGFGSELVTAHPIRTYDMAFAGVPGGPVSVTFVADRASGKDRVTKGAKELDDAFERAAEVSVKK